MADDARPNPVASTGAEAGEVIRLWPDGAPSSLPRVAEEAEFSRAVGGVMTTMVRNVSDPTLTVFRPVRGAGNGVGVIVCPGGGWRILAFEHEGIDLARWLAQRGYTAFLLKYRLRGTPADPDEYAARAAALATVAAARPPTRAAEAPRSRRRMAAKPWPLCVSAPPTGACVPIELASPAFRPAPSWPSM